MLKDKQHRQLITRPIMLQHASSNNPCLSHFTLLYPPFFVGLQPIDFVKTWPCLGHIISHNCDDSDDLYVKRQVSSDK